MLVSCRFKHVQSNQNYFIFVFENSTSNLKLEFRYLYIYLLLFLFPYDIGTQSIPLRKLYGKVCTSIVNLKNNHLELLLTLPKHLNSPQF